MKHIEPYLSYRTRLKQMSLWWYKSTSVQNTRNGQGDRDENCWDSPNRAGVTDRLYNFLQKREGTLRFWIYCCKLNAVTVTDIYPLLGMDEAIKLSVHATNFSRMEPNSSYSLVEPFPKDPDKKPSYPITQYYDAQKFTLQSQECHWVIPTHNHREITGCEIVICSFLFR